MGVESAVLEGAVGLRDQSLEGGAGDEMGCGLGWIWGLLYPGAAPEIVRELEGGGEGMIEGPLSKANEGGSAAFLSFLRRRQILWAAEFYGWE